MHLFDDLKSLPEELNNYLALYGIHLQTWRLNFYCQLLNEKKQKREPILSYLAQLPDLLGGAEHHLIIDKPNGGKNHQRNHFLAFKRKYEANNGIILSEKEALVVFKNYLEAKEFKSQLAKRKKEIIKLRMEHKASAELILASHKRNPTNQCLVIELQTNKVTEYETIMLAADKTQIDVKHLRNAAKNNHIVKGKFLVRFYPIQKSY